MSSKSKKLVESQADESDSDAGSDIESQVDDLDEVDKDLDEPEVLDEKDDEDIDDDIDEEEAEDDIERPSLKRSAATVLPKEPSEAIIVAPEQRVTSEFMTMYEYAMVIGTRATHISEGSPLYADSTGISDAREIAIKEIEMKRCPLSISRVVNGKIEIWEVNEMTRPA
jgi:DNA-directed RNA polymerase subunit K/omega